MKTSIIPIMAAALLCGCNKPAAPAPTRWEYSTFQFRPIHEESYGIVRCYLLEYGDWKPGGRTMISSNIMYDSEMVLNSIGGDGWELAWTDGTNFIMKRSSDVWSNGVFSVGEEIEPAK